jgi:hypothetical protein
VSDNFRVLVAIDGLPIQVDEVALVGWATRKRQRVFDELLEPEMARLPTAVE